MYLHKPHHDQPYAEYRIKDINNTLFHEIIKTQLPPPKLFPSSPMIQSEL